MFSDAFSKTKALELLKGKKIWFIGSSNMRAIYKDIIWLINEGNLASQQAFKVKNEPSYFSDKRISDDVLHNGRNYKETRVYNNNGVSLMFHFITRLYLEHFLDLIKSIKEENCPDVILLNSCLWDLTRWGPDGVANFKDNVLKTMKFLKNTLPAKTRVIWKTTLPVSTTADGAIFIDEIKFIVPMLPWHILEANSYASNCANFFNYDTMDLHHHMRMLGHLRVKDGIHWQPVALRLLSNIFLTHLCLSWLQDLPGVFEPSAYYIQQTTKVLLPEEKLKNRVEKKESYFQKLLKKIEKKVNTQLGGIKNKVLGAAKAITKTKQKFKSKLKNFPRYTQRVDKYNNNAIMQNTNNYIPNMRFTVPNVNNNIPKNNFNNIPNRSREPLRNRYGEIITNNFIYSNNNSNLYSRPQNYRRFY